jgi:TolB-like protein/DNA-binding winged helix-turn-helix (wHTH) protein/Tfp pilus assembly protein PilF
MNRSESATPTPKNFQFGPFQLDAASRTLLGDGARLALPSKAFDTLLVLVENHGQVLDKRTLMDLVWPDTAVEENNLAQSIGAIRKALGDQPGEPRYIATVPGKGYCFIAPVIDAPSDGAALARWPALLRRRLWLLAGGSSLILLTALLVGISRAPVRQLWAHRGATPVERIAVLPLVNLSGDQEQEYFADGMTDELITELARLTALQVISRTSVMRYKGTKKGVSEIARDLGVDAVIEGSVLRSGAKVRITVQLIDSAVDAHRWAGSFEGELGDVVSLQGRIAREVVLQIAGKLRQDELNRYRPRPRVAPEAYDAYLKGWHFLNGKQFANAASHFEEATEIDSGFALAHAMLYEAAGMMSYVRDLPLNDRALKAMRRARELDNNLSEVHTNFGDYEFYWNWNWATAEAEFRRAVELDPGSVYTALHYAACMHGLGRWDEAIREYRRALRLDPLSDILNGALVNVLIDAHRYEEALEQSKKQVELYPNDAGAYSSAAAVFAGLGREADAIKARLKADRLSGRNADSLASLERAAAAGGLHGYRKESLRQLEKRAKLHPVRPMQWAWAYAEVGAKDQLINMLEVAYAHHSPQLAWIRAKSVWDPYRSDPRFQSLLRRMRFPD